jgi:2'-5' RNA ligase
MIRAFIAINLPQAMRARLAQFEHELAASFVAGAARWVRPEQIHLTLKFLGDVPEESLSDLETALRRACQSSAPFELRADGLGCFPHARNARVLWIGLLGDLDRLEELQARVEEQSRNWSARDAARPFQPHMTIARVKELRLADRRRFGEEIAAHARVSLGGWRVDRVDLMQSVLSPHGADYECLADFALLGVEP